MRILCPARAVWVLLGSEHLGMPGKGGWPGQQTEVARRAPDQGGQGVGTTKVPFFTWLVGKGHEQGSWVIIKRRAGLFWGKTKLSSKGRHNFKSDCLRPLSLKMFSLIFAFLKELSTILNYNMKLLKLLVVWVEIGLGSVGVCLHLSIHSCSKQKLALS